MLLIVYYVILMVVGDLIAYGIGFAIERMWGSQASLWAFLVLYFAFLWVAWHAAVWLTKPKATSTNLNLDAEA